MNTKELKSKQVNSTRRAFRTRSRLRGTAKIPRLMVRISLRHVSAQLIDDEHGHTIAGVSTVGQKQAGKNMTEKAVWVGHEIATKAKDANIDRVVFDRGSKRYHGRISALADSARQKGLTI